MSDEIRYLCMEKNKEEFILKENIDKLVATGNVNRSDIVNGILKEIKDTNARYKDNMDHLYDLLIKAIGGDGSINHQMPASVFKGKMEEMVLFTEKEESDVSTSNHLIDQLIKDTSTVLETIKRVDRSNGSNTNVLEVNQVINQIKDLSLRIESVNSLLSERDIKWDYLRFILNEVKDRIVFIIDIFIKAKEHFNPSEYFVFHDLDTYLGSVNNFINLSSFRLISAFPDTTTKTLRNETAYISMLLQNLEFTFTRSEIERSLHDIRIRVDEIQSSLNSPAGEVNYSKLCSLLDTLRNVISDLERISTSNDKEMTGEYNELISRILRYKDLITTYLNTTDIYPTIKPSFEYETGNVSKPTTKDNEVGTTNDSIKDTLISVISSMESTNRSNWEDGLNTIYSMLDWTVKVMSTNVSSTINEAIESLLRTTDKWVAENTEVLAPTVSDESRFIYSELKPIIPVLTKYLLNTSKEKATDLINKLNPNDAINDNIIKTNILSRVGKMLSLYNTGERIYSDELKVLLTTYWDNQDKMMDKTFKEKYPSLYEELNKEVKREEVVNGNSKYSVLINSLIALMEEYDNRILKKRS